MFEINVCGGGDVLELIVTAVVVFFCGRYENCLADGWFGGTDQLIRENI